MSDRFEVTVPARVDYLVLVRHAVEEIGAIFGFPESELEKVILAVDEACSNSVESASQTGLRDSCIRVGLEISSEGFAVSVCDAGGDFRKEFERETDLMERIWAMETSGYGLPIIKQVMDFVKYEHLPGVGNRLVMTKRPTSRRHGETPAY